MSFAKVSRAGLIPFYFDDRNELYMMFMKPSDPAYGGDQFQIAKGKIESGEDPQDAAIREASEELGLMSRNIIETHFIGEFLGRTHLYVVEISDVTDFGPVDDETGAVTWMTLPEFELMGRPLHVPLVQAAATYILYSDV